MKTDILERVPMSLCKRFFALLFSEILSITHYVEGWNLISTLEFIVKSALQKEGYNIHIPGVIFKKSILVKYLFLKEAFFHYKMCHNFKSMKTMKENIQYICRPVTSEDLP